MSFVAGAVSLLTNCLLPIIVFSLAHAAILICTCGVLLSQLLATFAELILCAIPHLRSPPMRGSSPSGDNEWSRSTPSIPTSTSWFATLVDVIATVTATRVRVRQLAELEKHLALLDHFCPPVRRISVLPKCADSPMCTVCLDVIKTKALVRPLKCSHLFHSYVALFLELFVTVEVALLCFLERGHLTSSFCSTYLRCAPNRSCLEVCISLQRHPSSCKGHVFLYNYTKY